MARWLRTPLAELAYRPETDLSQQVISSDSRQGMGSFTQPLQPVSKATTPSLSNDKLSVVAQSPLAVLDTVSGFSLADDVLGRIEWGIAG